MRSLILVLSLTITASLAQETVEFQREVESPLGCSRSQQSREGDELLVTYKGFLADGTVFDSNEGKDPIRFVLGEGRVIAGWEKGLEGTCAGEKVVPWLWGQRSWWSHPWRSHLVLHHHPAGN